MRWSSFFLYPYSGHQDAFCQCRATNQLDKPIVLALKELKDKKY